MAATHGAASAGRWARITADGSTAVTSPGPAAERRAVDALRDDLSSGRWAERNHDLVDLDAAEPGLRLLVA